MMRTTWRTPPRRRSSHGSLLGGNPPPPHDCGRQRRMRTTLRRRRCPSAGAAGGRGPRRMETARSTAGADPHLGQSAAAAAGSGYHPHPHSHPGGSNTGGPAGAFLCATTGGAMTCKSTLEKKGGPPREPTNSTPSRGQTSKKFANSSSTSLKLRDASLKFRALRLVSCNFAKFSRSSRNSRKFREFREILSKLKNFVCVISPKQQFSLPWA
jgi:hypothetical protein